MGVGGLESCAFTDSNADLEKGVTRVTFGFCLDSCFPGYHTLIHLLIHLFTHSFIHFMVLIHVQGLG